MVAQSSDNFLFVSITSRCGREIDAFRTLIIELDEKPIWFGGGVGVIIIYFMDLFK